MASARAGFALITPASRGIGFALARQLLVHTDLPVCATARKECGTVHDKLVKSVDSKRDAAKRVMVLEADVTSKLDLKPHSNDIFLYKCNILMSV
jgi:NAD(P)-dependent dehydrogenase (short-subunit alcohol dehydrogenase family)